MSKTAKPKSVLLLKSGNRIVVDSLDPAVMRLLYPQLSFQEKKILMGYEARKAKDAGHSVVKLIDWDCYCLDHRGRIATTFGFWWRVYNTLTAAGYRVRMQDLAPHPRPEVYQPRWEALQEAGVTLREGQLEFLQKVLANRCGRFDCATGWGKSFAIALVGLLLPKARIDVVSRRAAVVRDRIFPELASMLPSVGIVGGGSRIKDRRIMCFTAGSLRHARGDADILFCDEIQELVTDATVGLFPRWRQSRNYGLSATHDMRLDNKDLRAEGLCGPILFKVGYQQAMENGLVVPIEVVWHPVITDTDPCALATDTVTRKRLGVWTHDYRNDLIAKDARQYDADTQVLITCETLEHAVNLKSRLPEFTLVYREDGMSPPARRRYTRQQLISANEPYMTVDRRQQLTKAFERGELKKVICTTVWNVGVSFNCLAVLIRADAGGSPINDTQIPGRVSRLAEGKKVGIVHDYEDQFNRGFRAKATSRHNSYAAHSWKQQRPKEAEGGLRSRMLWGDTD